MKTIDNIFNLAWIYILAFFLLTGSGGLNAQTQWTKYAANPVLQKGPATWDIIAIGQPTVLFENDTIKMWYAGVGNDFKGRICYAYSLDGITWTKHSNPVLDVGGPGEWDRGWLDTPEIVKDNNGYKLYYYGDSAWQFSAISSAIGMAYSTDGINWTKHPQNPVFTKGAPSTWDNSWIESPAVEFDSVNNQYEMWYNGVDTNTWLVQIGYATSTDGVVWTKDPSNPVLITGLWGAYDDMWLGTPAVITRGLMYEMWYAAASSVSYNVSTQAFDSLSICYATSSDGVSWVKHPMNPLFNTYTAPHDSLLDEGGPWAPDVIFNPNTQTYMMWFEAAGGFMLATAPLDNVGIEKTKDPNQIKVFPNPLISQSYIHSPCLKGASMDIYDMQGRLIEHKSGLTGNKTELCRGRLERGMYIIKLFDNENVFSGVFMVE